MQTANGSLTILNAHTKDPQVFWNGSPVEIKGLKVQDGKVTIKIKEENILAEMQDAGIKIVRVQ